MANVRFFYLMISLTLAVMAEEFCLNLTPSSESNYYGPNPHGQRGPVGKAGPVGPPGPQGEVGNDGQCVCNFKKFNDITFTFPRTQQIEDWVRYLLPIPQLKELTACFWVTPSAFGDRFPVSYALGTAQNNAFLLKVKSSTQFHIHLNQRHDFSEMTFKINKQSHLCVGMSQPLRKVVVHQNGVKKDELELNDANYFFPGKGSLMFGQEQDDTFGSFDANQAFSGNLTNFMIYPRLLSDTEIRGIAFHCQHPDDVIIRPQLTNIEWNGQATVSHPVACPKVED